MDKKQELLINAAKIIHEDGVQNFTMEALAKKSNITKGGVLYHFKSKSDLLLRMNEFVIEQFEMKMNHYRSEEHTSELQSRFDLVCRLLLEKKKTSNNKTIQR